ncbi:hypothetical protein CXB51_029957 [Gossypium anomalum]|uniref:Late embryogenesis abundant protein LEA-2 subgroup domain-containing protein n=1 Tax=Gossypium anomalum TaxID=47600 RepID=A0A8J6CNK5_9ROSI|nr:hypothetical protein CXB51_029957 [Gossypium anomalum]
MVERDQVRPLAPAADAPTSDDGEAALQLKKVRRKKLIRCCACIAAFFIILAVVIIVLIFTVFRVKDPIIKLNAVSLTNLDLINGSIPTTGSNISLIADVSVKNPNIASFKYSNTTTTLYYYGTEVGDARGPGGTAKARRTIQMNITVDIMTDRVLASPNLTADLTSGTLTMISYSRIGGRVNMLNIIKKHVTVMMNCTVTVNITSQAIQDRSVSKRLISSFETIFASCLAL